MAQHTELKKSRKRLVIGISGAVAALALVVVGVFFLYGHGQENAQQEAPQAETTQPEVTAPPVTDKAAPVAEEEPEPVPAKLDPQYILILGDDAWEEYVPGHSDLMMLMRVDFEKSIVTLVSIPRDTAYAFGDTLGKINYAYTWGGSEDACKAVSSIVGVEVTQYVTIGFDGLQSIVDSFGGLYLNVPYSINYKFYTKDFPDEYFYAGEQTLTPWRTMALSRARTGYADYGLQQDMIRQIVDRQMMVRLVENAFSDPANTASLLVNLAPYVSTNIPIETIAQWATELSTNPQITVYGTSGPVDGGINDATQLWLVPNDQEKWQALMAVVNAGGDPSTVDAQFPGNVQSDIAPINSTTIIGLN